MAERNQREGGGAGGGRELRGGTEHGDAARELGPDLSEGGTRDHTAPSGGIHVERPAQAVSHTGLADRPLEGGRSLAGGRSAEQLRGYLAGVSFPAKKDTLVRAVRRNGAPEDVLGAMERLGQTEYASEDDFLRDYPRLPDAEPAG